MGSRGVRGADGGNGELLPWKEEQHPGKGKDEEGEKTGNAVMCWEWQGARSCAARRGVRALACVRRSKGNRHRCRSQALFVIVAVKAFVKQSWGKVRDEGLLLEYREKSFLFAGVWVCGLQGE